MGMFTMRKPRSFNHRYIYVDERKEKLAKMEEKAKRDLGASRGGRGHRRSMRWGWKSRRQCR